MSDKYSNRPTRLDDKELLKKKIHRALVEARNARYQGDEETVKDIISRIMADAAPAAYKASREGPFNWVVEALKPLDEMLLPDDE
jgi:hypothetical protein